MLRCANDLHVVVRSGRAARSAWIGALVLLPPALVASGLLCSRPGGWPLSTMGPGALELETSTISATGGKNQAFLRDFWNAPIPQGEARYYDGMLHMLGLLYDSGKFRIWPH